MSLNELSSIDTYCTHLHEVVLPTWLSKGFCAKKGLFAERLDFQGGVIHDVPHRAMVQARQIYVYGHAALSGIFPAGGEIALQAMENLLARYGDAAIESGFCFSISPDNKIISPVRDSYTHAFILLSLATTYQLSGDKRLRHAIEKTTLFVEKNLVDQRFFGVHDQWPPLQTRKAQNPLMHLLEAYLAVHEALPDGGFLDRASDIVRHFRDKIWIDELGILAEYYDDDWSKLDRRSDHAFFEPGHQFEWAWLLNWYGTLSGVDQKTISGDLWTSACRHGLKDGRLCYDEISLSMEVRKASHRLWPHTEAAKIAAVRAGTGMSDGLSLAQIMTLTLNDIFLRRPFEGGWIDRVDGNTMPLVDFVPASSLYHLYSASVALMPLTTNGLFAKDKQTKSEAF